MENASKALIIAGAILLSILIIGLGMFIYTQAANAMGKANLNSEKATSYNAKFLSYEGTKSGTEVRSLLDAVRQHNLSNTDDVSLQIAVQDSSAAGVTTTSDKLVTATEVNTLKANIKAGKTYTVDFGYDTNSGYIVAVGIVEKK